LALEGGDVKELSAKPPAGAPACSVCGCTQECACLPASCSWVTTSNPNDPPLCTACVYFLANVRRYVGGAMPELLAVLGIAPSHLARAFKTMEIL
jgi:hypothetical protein